MISPLLAYEIFDDVASFWFVLTLIGFVVIPRAFFFIVSIVWKYALSPVVTKKVEHSEQDGVGCKCNECLQKQEETKKDESKEKIKKWISLWNFIYFVLLIVFIVMLIGIPQKQGEKMAQFNPFEVLELPEDGKGVTANDITKAYRKMSLKYHPDKSKEPDAEKKFILIAKAYQTLTDEATRENYEKYGNPDGYQGTSVTIGLPSFLTKKENERPILLTYLGGMIVLCIVVTVWWNKSKQFAENGVMRDTLGIFGQLINSEQMACKFLIEVLAAAAEYRPISEGSPSQEAIEAMRRLDLRVKDQMVKQKYDTVPYIAKGSRLIYAYLLREEIPPVFKEDIKTILKHAHRLLDCMVEFTAIRGFLPAMLSAIELQQRLTQQLWVYESSLLQLPHFGDREVKACARKHIKTVEKFRHLALKEREKLLRDLTKEQLDDIDKVAQLFPELDVNFTFEVEGEDEQTIYTGDCVTISLEMERKILDDLDLTNVVEEKDGADTPENSKKEDRSETLQREGPAVDIRLRRKEQPKIEDDVEEDDPMNLRWKGFNPNKRIFVDKAPAKLVHAPLFPIPKREVWYIFIWDRTSKQVVAFQKLTSFQDYETMDLKLQIPGEAGIRVYDLYVMCDSYVDCDRKISFKLAVVKSPNEEKDPEEEKKKREERKREREERKAALGDDGAAASADEEEEDEDEELSDEDEEKEEEDPPFFSMANLKEIILNVVVITLLCVFLFNFMYSRGWTRTISYYWAAYCAPLWDRTVGPYLAPLREFLVGWFNSFNTAQAEYNPSPEDAYQTD